MAKLEGVIPAIPTPLLPNEDVDTEALGRLIDFVIEGGASVIFILGNMGEGAALLDSQKRAAVKAAVSRVRGRVPLLAAISEVSTRRTVESGKAIQELGPSVSAPEIAPAHGTPKEVVEGARQLLGAPYRLGGTTPEGLDCSGLTQRAYRAGLGVILPRHSTDQLQATLRLHSAPRRHGNLVFAWTAREGPCHVGILVADVSGHGMPAALIASMLKIALAAQAPHAADPAGVLHGLNQALCGKFSK